MSSLQRIGLAPAALPSEPSRFRTQEPLLPTGRSFPISWLRGTALAAAIGFGVLASCAPRPTGPDDVLRFVTWKPQQPAVWDDAIRRFEAAHPGTRVERQFGPASSTAFHDLLTQKLKNRDTGVDVFLMDVVWPAEFAAAGWTLPLDGLLDAAERAAFLPAAVEAATWQERLYGLPAFVDVGWLYYRSDLLARHGRPVPATWDELVATAETIASAERGTTPRMVGYTGQFQQYEGLVCDMLELVAANRGSFLDAAASRSALSAPRTIEAVRWTRDRLIGTVAPRGVFTYQEPESLAVFVQGEAVFHRNWPYAWDVANDPRQSRVAGRVGVAPLPRFPGGESAAALGGWIYGVSAFSRHPEQALELVRFLTSEDAQRTFAVEASLAPTRAALYDDPAVLARNPPFRSQAGAFRRAVARPVTPVYPAVSASLQRFFSAALVDPASNLEALARNADAEIDHALALARVR